MTTVTIHQAKTNLSKLIAAVLAGEEVIVANGKQPVVKIVPLEPLPKKKRELGWLAHTIPPGKDPLADGFWDPLPDEDLALWNGENNEKMGANFLLDTHALIWAATAPTSLGRLARETIEDGDNTIFVSAVSAMEIATKHRLGKLAEGKELASDFVNQATSRGFIHLALTAGHGQLAGKLPFRHRDPFDRMLIAQAQLERMTLISNEKLFDSFGVVRLW